MNPEYSVRTKLLLIGQAPSRTGDPSVVLEGRIGRRLASLMNLSFACYLTRTERLNLFDEWTGRSGKGDAWNKEQALKRAEGIAPLLRDRRVVFLGRNVAEAFGAQNLLWLTWVRMESLESEVAIVPHPSGIVLWWNNEENQKRASRFLSTAVRGEVLHT